MTTEKEVAQKAVFLPKLVWQKLWFQNRYNFLDILAWRVPHWLVDQVPELGFKLHGVPDFVECFVVDYQEYCGCQLDPLPEVQKLIPSDLASL